MRRRSPLEMMQCRDYRIERSLRALRLSGMTATLETRALQVAQQQMDFIEAFSALVQDELDRAPIPADRSAVRALGTHRAQRPQRLTGSTTRRIHGGTSSSLRTSSSSISARTRCSSDHRASVRVISRRRIALLAVQRGYTVFYARRMSSSASTKHVNSANSKSTARRSKPRTSSCRRSVLAKVAAERRRRTRDLIMSRYEKSPR